MKALPNSVKHYKSTPLFDENSIPKGFLSNHTTKPGTWGLLIIESGQLNYIITESGYEEEVILTPSNPGVIEPSTTHYIRANCPVRFYVKFYK